MPLAVCDVVLPNLWRAVQRVRGAQKQNPFGSGMTMSTTSKGSCVVARVALCVVLLAVTLNADLDERGTSARTGGDETFRECAACYVHCRCISK